MIELEPEWMLIAAVGIFASAALAVILVHWLARWSAWTPPRPEDQVQDDFTASVARWGHLRDRRAGDE